MIRILMLLLARTAFAYPANAQAASFVRDMFDRIMASGSKRAASTP